MHDWLNREAYPFAPHYMKLDAGRMHYVDEGRGHPVVMVHGTPTWSFLYRHLIRGLRGDTYRAIAPDHLGFGLSDKPEGWSYKPEDQARNLAAFIEWMELDDITLVVHDFGGPIGLSYALDNPQNVKRLVVFNTWMWSLAEDTAVQSAGRVMGSVFGRFLYRQFNFSVNMMMPFATGEAELTPEAYRHYRRVLPSPSERTATWVFARELLRSSAWYESLWARRERIAGIPALLLWGMKDPTFGAAYLERMQTMFSHAETVTFPEVGHFVQEEKGAELVPLIADFLGQAAPT